MNASAASTHDWAISPPWVKNRSFRLSDRSATEPAHALNSRIGPN